MFVAKVSRKTKSANGAVRFTYPGILAVREIDDIRLVSKDGESVEAKAAKGDELLQQIIEVDGQPCHFQQVLAEKVWLRLGAGRFSVGPQILT